MSRFHARPTSPDALVQAVDEAFRHMALDPGPATIEVATDVMAAAAGSTAPRVTRVALPAPDPEAVARARVLIDAADAPLIWAGGGARHAAADVRSWPSCSTRPSSPHTTARARSRPATPCMRGRRSRSRRCAAWSSAPTSCLALGTRFSQEGTADWGLPMPATIVQVDLDEGRFGRTFPVTEGIVADVGLFCRALVAHPPSAGGRDGEAAVRAALQGRSSEVGAQGADTEVELMHVLHEALPDDAIVVADMTIAAYWAALYLDAKRPGAFVYPSSGALGCGIPLPSARSPRTPTAPRSRCAATAAS